MTTREKKIVTAKSVKAVATAPLSSRVAATPTAPVTAPEVAPKGTGTPVAKRSAPVAKIPAKPSLKSKVEKLAKVKKPKLVRDSYTIPKAEYTVLDDLKQRAGKLEVSVKKSELLRAGIKALAAMSNAGFLAAVKVVPTIKTGRPTKD